MPDETLITEIENILSQIVALGGENERTAIVPNLTVQDANPTGLDGYVIVSDDRDGDNIPAKKVGSIVYSDNDLVNVMFLKGAEAIAFQQGSQSANSGIWEIVPSTSTDIFYDKGDVGIGKSVAPDATLEVLDTSQAQLRLTHTEDTKFVDFALDTNHDLTITPSSTGQIKLQATTDSTNFFQVLDADGGTSVLDVDTTNERVGVGTDTPDKLIHMHNPSGFADFKCSSGSDAHGGRFEFATATGNNPVVGLHGSGYVAVPEYTNKLVFQTFGRDIAISAYNTGDEIHMYTGGRTAAFRRVTIDGTGRMGIKTASPAAQLHVDQVGTTTAIPVLYLDQADVSEEMIEFNTTIGTGNAIEAVGAKTLTTTHFIKVTLPGALTRYIPVGTIA